MLFQHLQIVFLAFGVGLAPSCSSAIDSSPKLEQGSVTIPLTSIWAWDMPGTRDVRELEKVLVLRRDEDLIKQIRRSLSKSENKTTKFTTGFVVLGHDYEALKNAHAVLVKRNKSGNSISFGKPASLVFFSHSSSQYVHLNEVRISDGKIDIHYKFVPHKTKELTAHYAIVPLTDLPKGKYFVDMKLDPLSKEQIAAGFKPVEKSYVQKIICRPFTFTICE